MDIQAKAVPEIPLFALSHATPWFEFKPH